MSVTGEREVLDAYDAAELADELGEPDRLRPVIVETRARYVVWVEEAATAEGLQCCAYELVPERGEPPMDADVTVADPDDMDWWHICNDDWERVGPANAPLQGPDWQCACGTVRYVSDQRARGHYPNCPNAPA